LYLVKEIVNNAGGKIVLDSQPAEGTEIKIFLKDE
jgi:Signal transduction histidine kinase regulating citrate/malate metabolism